MQNNSSVAPRSDNEFCASLFMIRLNISVLLCFCAQVLEDIGAIEVYYYYYYVEACNFIGVAYSLNLSAHVKCAFYFTIVMQ